MKVKKVEITNKQGYKITGLLDIGKEKKLIIICNGYEITKEFSSVKLLAKDLSKKGYNVFRFDFSGTGESKGPKNIFLTRQVDDLNSIVNFFKNYKTIILLGVSLGALSASIVSIINPKVTHLITVNGFFGGSELGREVKKTYLKYRLATIILPAYRKDYKFYKDSLLPHKIKTPVLVIFKKDDNTAHPIQSKRFFSQLSLTKNKKLLPLSLKEHGLTGSGDVEQVVSSINI